MTINDTEIRNLVAELAQAWNAHAPDAVARVYAENARFVIYNFPREVSGQLALLAKGTAPPGYYSYITADDHETDSSDQN